MAFLEWKPQYSVGSQAIDDEHRDMIDLISALHDKLGAAADQEAIDGFLGDVHAGISMHFALEERLMRDAHYAEFAAHKQDHEELLDQIVNIMDEMTDSGEGLLEALEERLSAWFGTHFSTFDARLHGKLGAHAHSDSKTR